MANIKKPIYEWSENTGIASVMLYDEKNRVFIGSAVCAKEDKDMKSQKVGQEIAGRRAEIDLIRQHIKDLKWEKKILQDLLSTYKNHPKHNDEDWQEAILKRKIYNLILDIETFKTMYKDKFKDLQDYIHMKEIFYQKVRKAREIQGKHEHPEE